MRARKEYPQPPPLGENRAALARSVVARQLLALLVERSADDLAEQWGDFPEIGEHDWNLIVEEALRWANHVRPGEANFEHAYEVLTARAAQWEAEHGGPV